jgi:hypothetical protein
VAAVVQDPVEVVVERASELLERRQPLPTKAEVRSHRMKKRAAASS